MAILQTPGMNLTRTVCGLTVDGPWRPRRSTPPAGDRNRTACAYRDIPIVYYEWPLVVIGLIARFAWLGVLVAWLAWAAGARELSDQARVDGASEPMVATRIRLAAHFPALAAGGVVVAVLALAEIATASLVRVPSVGLISLILIEKFHRLEDGMLAALSLWLVIPAVAAALLAGIALHPWSLPIRRDSTTDRAR
ncbi:MAG: hypothetical protein IIB57_10220 [Planctomycetes bacterium]|nr:hypothetical protein [Planctomycetota bacterium]